MSFTPIRDRHNTGTVKQEYDLSANITYADPDTKTFVVGGFNAQDGIIEVRDDSNETVVTINNEGILVNTGNYKLIEDDVTINIEHEDNLIYDHSFELLVADVGVAGGFGDEATFINGTWTADTGSPRIRTVYETDNTPYRFGYTMLSVNSTNSARNSTIIAPSTEYTISVYSAINTGRNSTGTPVLKIRLYESGIGGALTRTLTKELNTTDDVYKLYRDDYSFTTASNEGVIEVVLESTDSDWVLFDGIQLVERDLAATYIPETTLYGLIRS